MTLLTRLTLLLIAAMACTHSLAAQNISGTAVFGTLSVPFQLDGATAVPPQPNGTGEITVPNPTPPPATVQRTIRWERVVINDVEWFRLWRDGALIGAIRLPAGDVGNAWLNDGSNGGAGQVGTWS
jgi:hypothetical protein